MKSHAHLFLCQLPLKFGLRTETKSELHQQTCAEFSTVNPRPVSVHGGMPGTCVFTSLQLDIYSLYTLSLFRMQFVNTFYISPVSSAATDHPITGARELCSHFKTACFCQWPTMISSVTQEVVKRGKTFMPSSMQTNFLQSVRKTDQINLSVVFTTDLSFKTEEKPLTSQAFCAVSLAC